ncbi:Aquaporin-3 [Clonorchis sinensis]|uniref:Aquaporin-3 n=2 Tax=Clonorchis sinensis TaxID=79923 RepID=A0A8T1LWH4_CLOSI|nr:Aquaporin-3 [Clonorchis sinensis]GAA55323.1 aquaporin-9 [Clonorchis sinensis]
MGGCYDHGTFRSKISKVIGLRNVPIVRACIAEFCGTAMMIIYGCGVLAQVKLGKKHGKEHGEFLSISWNWGLAVTLGVFFAGGNGHGLINPAVTLGFAIIGKIPWIRVPFYTLSQILGAFFGAMLVYGVNAENIIYYSQTHDNGMLLVNTTGDIFVTNPWVSTFNCFFDQTLGTALLTAGALAIVEKETWNVPDHLHPLYLGLLVFSLVGAYALNAGCALNPARDLGPRLMILAFGWTDAFSAGQYHFWVPIVGPYLGAVLGALGYELTIGVHIGTPDKETEQNNENNQPKSISA